MGRLRFDHEVRGDNVSFYYFMNGSPASGSEALAIVELMVRGVFDENTQVTDWHISGRVCPLLYLGIGHMGLKQKCFGFL